MCSTNFIDWRTILVLHFSTVSVFLSVHPNFHRIYPELVGWDYLQSSLIDTTIQICIEFERRVNFFRIQSSLFRLKYKFNPIWWVGIMNNKKLHRVLLQLAEFYSIRIARLLLCFSTCTTWWNSTAIIIREREFGMQSICRFALSSLKLDL